MINSLRRLFVASVFMTSTAFAVPKINIHDGASLPDLDTYWCRGSMVPEQDPIFTEIRRSRFQIDKNTDIVTIPQAWKDEVINVRGPQLKAATETRLPVLLKKAEVLVGRPFKQKEFDYFFYLCPFFGGGTAGAKIYPMFMYLKSAVGAQQWPDWLFTDQYLFHEILHNFVMEKITYTDTAKLSPVLQILGGQLWADRDFETKAKIYLGYPIPTPPDMETKWATEDKVQMIGLVLTHVHVYGIMTAVLKNLGESSRLNLIRSWETQTASAHPSYVKAWEYIQSIESNPIYMRALLDEVK